MSYHAAGLSNPSDWLQAYGDMQMTCIFWMLRIRRCLTFHTPADLAAAQHVRARLCPVTLTWKVTCLYLDSSSPMISLDPDYSMLDIGQICFSCLCAVPACIGMAVKCMLGELRLSRL